MTNRGHQNKQVQGCWQTNRKGKKIKTGKSTKALLRYCSACLFTSSENMFPAYSLFSLYNPFKSLYPRRDNKILWIASYTHSCKNSCIIHTTYSSEHPHLDALKTRGLVTLFSLKLLEWRGKKSTAEYRRRSNTSVMHHPDLSASKTPGLFSEIPQESFLSCNCTETWWEPKLPLKLADHHLSFPVQATPTAINSH